MCLLILLRRLIVRLEEVWFLLRDVLEILRNGDVDRLEGLLKVRLNHVHIFTGLIFEHLVDLE